MKLIIVPPKTVSSADKQSARKAGFVVIEMQDPTKAVIMSEGMIITGSDVLNAAIGAIAKCDSVTGNSEFVKRLDKLLNLNQ